MAKPLTTHERVTRMFARQEADCIPVTDEPWGSTIARWHREGMPDGQSYVDYFGLDLFTSFGVDVTPRYPVTIVEETDDYVIKTTSWGVTMRNWKNATSTPEFLDFKIVSPDTWREARARMTPSDERIPWENLNTNYQTMRDKGAWIEARFWFGFDVTHSWAVGTERVLMAMVEDPEWVMDMFNHYLDLNIALYERIIAAGYKFDAIRWPDDMGYKLNQFFSLNMYREMLKPVQQRAIEWAHANGMKAFLHSCGDIRPFIPELISIGLDGLNPIEVKAGMDPLAIKRQYGDKLLLHGGVNAVLWDKPQEIAAEMQRVIPQLKQNGGYIFSSDHSVPSSVSLEDFRNIVNLARKLGKYS